MKNKNLKIVLYGTLLTSIIIGSTCLLNLQKENDNLKTSIKDENSLRIVSIKNANSSNSYGIKYVYFETGSKINNDTLLYKIEYYDNSQVEDGILSIQLVFDEHKLIIECLKPFNKQIRLTLYSQKNEEIQSSISIDFLEKYSLNPFLEVIENRPLSVNSNITSTGGSIVFEKQMSNFEVSFNENFLNNAKSLLVNTYYKKEYVPSNEYRYIRVSEQYFGLTNQDCTNWFENSFDYDSFAQSIYLNAIYNKVNSANETIKVNVQYDLTSLSKEDLLTLFDGNSPVFDCSFEIQNISYNYSFGLDISNLSYDFINITNDPLIF